MCVRSPAVLLLILLLGAPGTSAAQRVSGSVVRDESGAPIGGAIVSAFAGRDTAATTLTRSDGSFQLNLPSRRERTLLVRAIGLRPAQIALSGRSDTVVHVRMTVIALPSVRVQEFARCERNETGTADIADVWTEVTTALENTRLVRNSERRRFHYQLYELQMDFASGRQRVLRNDSSSWVATRPFRVTPPRELASLGYVVEGAWGGNVIVPRLNARGTLQYRAPDEMVLLDPSFQRTHCFWASNRRDSTASLIGVHFLPLTDIRINDIRGVFWIDAASYELKRLEYVYTQISQRNDRAAGDSGAVDSTATLSRSVTPGLRNPEPGGILEFARLPDGSFIIPGWRIYVNDTWLPWTQPGVDLSQPKIGKETGGRVLMIQPIGGI